MAQSLAAAQMEAAASPENHRSNRLPSGNASWWRTEEAKPMAINQLTEVLQTLRKAAYPEQADLTDGQLLESYIRGREESAFAVLVHRHGRPLVRGASGVSRRPYPHQGPHHPPFLPHRAGRQVIFFLAESK
jgi:hypothetical protein